MLSVFWVSGNKPSWEAVDWPDDGSVQKLDLKTEADSTVEQMFLDSVQRPEPEAVEQQEQTAGQNTSLNVQIQFLFCFL